MRLVKWHQVPSYYDTVLCNNSRLLHSTVKKKKKKKWQTRHQVPRCWPHSTVCRSPGHGIWSTWANGDIPMYIWPDNRNTGRFLEPPFRSQEPFPLPETEVTSSKMAGGSGNGSWLLNGGSKNLPILLRYEKAVHSDHFHAKLKVKTKSLISLDILWNRSVKIHACDLLLHPCYIESLQFMIIFRSWCRFFDYLNLSPESVCK